MRKLTVFHGANQEFEVRERPVAEPAPGTAGLSLISSGICGTDVHIHGGYLAMPDIPLVIGHEFIGTVDALGEGAARDALGNELHRGDRVIACVAIPCGKCFNCLRGETASCLNFGVTYVKNADEPPYFHGGFAEYLYSPFENLVRLPDSVDPFAAAAFPCGGPTVIRACAYGGGLNEGELVVIQGNGSLGMFAAAWAKAHGCRTIVLGSASNPERARLTEALKPDLFLDYRRTPKEEAAERVRKMAADLKRGDGADVVIETSGSADALPVGLPLLRTRGRYFIPGQYSDRGLVAIPPHMITFRALQLFGSGQYTMKDLAEYVSFLAAHRDLQPLFAGMVAKFPVSQINEAMRSAKDGKAVKTVLTMA